MPKKAPDEAEASKRAVRGAALQPEEPSPLKEAKPPEDEHNYSFIMGLAHHHGFGSIASKSTGLAHLHDAAAAGHDMAKRHAKRHGPRKGSQLQVGVHLGGTALLRPGHLDDNSSHIYCGTWDESDEDEDEDKEAALPPERQVGRVLTGLRDAGRDPALLHPFGG